MAERIHEKLSKKLNEALLKFSFNKDHKYTDPKDLIRSLAAEMPHDPDKAIKEFDNNHQNRTNWAFKVQTNHMAYLQFKNQAQTWDKEEKKILNIERKAARMALFYRVLTTIFVGFTIMGIYAVAHCLGVPMPLMRMPI